MVHFKDTWEELILNHIAEMNERGSTMQNITFSINDEAMNISWKFKHGFRYSRTFGLSKAPFRVRLTALQEIITDKILT